MRDLTSGPYWDEFAARQVQPVEAVPTHLPGLNKLCCDDGGRVGFARGWFITIGANPGFGKSALALNLTSAAMKAGEPVGYCSLEMTHAQLAARLYAIHSGTPIAGLERGRFSEAAFDGAKEHMMESPSVYLPDGIISTWVEVINFCEEAADAGARCFIIDYLQLIQTGDEDAINRAISEVVTELRAWAAERRHVVIILSQFNRVTSGEYRQRPRSQGLWGGMVLEASSDLVLLLDHSRYKRDGHTAKTWLALDKNRHGPVGDLPILWDYRNLQMREALEGEVGLWPK